MGWLLIRPANFLDALHHGRSEKIIHWPRVCEARQFIAALFSVLVGEPEVQRPKIDIVPRCDDCSCPIQRLNGVLYPHLERVVGHRQDLIARQCFFQDCSPWPSGYLAKPILRDSIGSQRIQIESSHLEGRSLATLEPFSRIAYVLERATVVPFEAQCLTTSVFDLSLSVRWDFVPQVFEAMSVGWLVIEIE